MKRIELIATGDLASGMVVAQAVLDDTGRVLIPAGLELSDNSIASLVRRDIESVMVELVMEEDPAELEARRLRAKQQLDQLFRNAGNAPETRALYQAILDYRTEQGA